MKIESHWYSLQPAQKLNSQVGVSPRFGSLLRITFNEEEVGYTDLHPWPEWGDQPLHEQLKLLKAGTPTALAEQALNFARIDAEARARGRSVFSGLPVLQNHSLVTDCAVVLPTQFEGQIVKLKVGRDLEFEREWIKAFCAKPGLLRLDFNSSLQGADFLKWLSGFRDQELKKIDYIEDPCVFDLDIWSQALEKVQLAADLEVADESLRSSLVLIRKPTAIEMVDPMEYKRVVFTHKMDHPFGARIALFVASTFYHLLPEKKEICGLDPQGVYAATGFEGAEEGSGFGFDSTLRDLKWTTL